VALRRKEPVVLIIAATPPGYDRLRHPRGIVAVLAMIAYLLAGLLHGVCDLDVTNPSGNTVIALPADDGAHQSGKAVAGEHHCHACFAVATPRPVQAVTRVEPAAAIRPRLTSRDSGLVPGLEPPPPKSVI
jgi:hypothetical protein